LACKNTGRQFKGCEIDPDYVNIVNKILNGRRFHNTRYNKQNTINRFTPKKVWRLDNQTHEKLELYKTINDAAKWVFDNKLTSITDLKLKKSINSKICAVCKNKRNTAYGFEWTYA
jgi:hypothetical protein